MIQAIVLALLLLSATPVFAQQTAVLVNQIGPGTPRETIAQHMDAALQAEASAVRVDFFWYSVQWTSATTWDWTYLDMVVDEATVRGLRIIPVVWGTPRWAVAPGAVYRFSPPAALGSWDAFLRALVARYTPRGVRVWEIWNEPDSTYYWRGSSQQYVELVAHAHAAIRATDPTAEVWLGGLAQGGPNVVVDFLEQILARGAGLFYDVHNIHVNFLSMAGLRAQIERNRAVLARYGLWKPVVVTEASYTSDPAYQGLTGYQDGDAGLARYLTDAYAVMLSNDVDLAVWSALRDYGTDAHEYTQSGLLRADFGRKPAFTAFQSVAPHAVTLVLTGTPSTGPYAVEARASRTSGVRVTFVVNGSTFRTESVHKYCLFGGGDGAPVPCTTGRLAASRVGGTFTVVARLYDVTTGALLATSTALTVTEGKWR